MSDELVFDKETFYDILREFLDYDRTEKRLPYNYDETKEKLPDELKGKKREIAGLKINLGIDSSDRLNYVYWLGFTDGADTIAQGIFPAICHYKKEKIVFFAYGERKYNIGSEKKTIEAELGIDKAKDYYRKNEIIFGKRYVKARFDYTDDAAKLDLINLDAMLSKINELFDDYKTIIDDEEKQPNTESPTETSTKTPILSKNIILYGAPGTGKTYSTVLRAVSIIEGETEGETPDKIKNEDYNDVLNRYHMHKDYGLITFTTFHQSFGYEEFIEGIRPDVKNDVGEIKYKYHNGIFKEFCEKAKDDKEHKYVFIIDEINRGNISKIFGELITLIEPTKRLGAKEEMKAILPYTQEEFGVPDNVYIIGTMNTADRSIAMIDTALRRRFDFVEMRPDAELLEGIVVKDVDGKDIDVKDINIANMLKTINERIEALLDRERVIGHSYFLPLKDDPSIGRLAAIFEQKIIPLLQEYFYDDYEKIRYVLGDNRKKDDTCFVKKKDNIIRQLFGAETGIEHPEIYDIYEINNKAFKNPDAYKFFKKSERE